jgi:GMP synthase-like glutamine amidotransferase
MRMHILRHVAFEDEASIGEWAKSRGIPTIPTDLYAGNELPRLEGLDWLVVMGGPMSVHDELQHPWLRQEKAFLREALNQGKRMVGICLGAQLIAEVLGARVTRNPHQEIGWFPVELTQEGRQCALFDSMPSSFPAFHWHGETFSIPPGAVHLASSAGCRNQGFLYDGRVLGLQFHPETTPTSMERLIAHCGNGTGPGPYVQTGEEMRGRADFQAMGTLLESLLDGLSR